MQKKKQNNTNGTKLVKDIIHFTKKYYRQNFVIFLIGITLSLTSTFKYKIIVIPLENQFGLLQTLPFLFWVGLIIMFINLLFGIKKNSNKVYFIKSLIFFVLIWNIPTLFENNFSVWDSSSHFRRSLEVIKIVPALWEGYSHDWPGFFIFGFFLYKISFLPVLTFLKYYRIFASVLGFIAIWFLFRRFTKNEYEFRHALILSSLLSVWHQFHYSPHSIGFPISLAIVILTQFNSVKSKLAVFILGSFLVVSHPTTFLILISFLGSWTLFSFLTGKLKKDEKFKRDSRKIFFVFLILGIIWFAWLLNQTNFSSSEIVPKMANFITSATSGDLIGQVKSVTGQVISRDTINQESVIFQEILGITDITESMKEKIGVNNLATLKALNKGRVGYLTQSRKIRLVALILISLLCLIYFVRALIKKEFDSQNIFLFSWLFGLGILLLFIQTFKGLEFRDRIFLYFMIISPMIIIKTIKHFNSKKIRKTFLTMIYLLAIIIFLTMYFDEATYLVNDSFIHTNEFITVTFMPCKDVNCDYSLIKNIQDSFSIDSPYKNVFVVSRSKFNWVFLKGGILSYQVYNRNLEATKDKIYSNYYDSVYAD